MLRVKASFYIIILCKYNVLLTLVMIFNDAIDINNVIKLSKRFFSLSILLTTVNASFVYYQYGHTRRA